MASKQENSDVRGYIYNNVGRGIIYAAVLGGLLSTYLKLANAAAGCDGADGNCPAEDDDGGGGGGVTYAPTAAPVAGDPGGGGGDECGRVWGLRPATLISQARRGAVTMSFFVVARRDAPAAVGRDAETPRARVAEMPRARVAAPPRPRRG